MTSLEMQAFLAVQDAGSITKAAELLYISQSSLSTRLQTLEQELGCKLFVRGRGAKAMALTPEGEQFLPLARQHQALERKMSNLTQDKPEEHIIRLSSFNSIGTYLLPPILQRFSQLWSDTRLQIRDIFTAEAINAIVRDELDLAFSVLSISTEHVTSIPFLLEPMVLLCAADAPYPDPVPQEALDAADEVYTFWCADVQQWHQATFGADAQPRVSLELSSQIPLFAARPKAWAIVPYSIADSLRDVQGLRCCKADFPIPDRRLYILCNRKSLESQPVRCFLVCVKTALQERNIPGLLL